MNSLKYILYFHFILFMLPVSASGSNYVPLSEILKLNKASVKVVSLGGHTGSCVSLYFENLSKDSLKFFLEPGRRLDSEDSAMQDILIVKEAKIELLAGEKKTIKGYGFCCQSGNHSPAAASEFNIGEMAPDDWVGLAKLLNKSSLPPSVMQNAVWIFSNDHSVASLPSGNSPALDSLRNYISKTRKIEFPWYYIDYVQDSTVFSGKPSRISGNLKFDLKHNAVISVVVRYKQNGLLIYTILKEKGYSRGSYAIPMDMDVKNWPKGNYEISVFADLNNLVKKELFELR